MSGAKVIPVSLILTTLNEESQVETFFEGVLGGSVIPAEIVICDGGSTDGTVERLKEFQGDGLLNVHVYEEPGATIARGRNIAVSHTSNDIIAVTDAGCLIDENWLLRITEALLEDRDVDVVAGGYELIGDSRFQRCTAAVSIPPEKLDPATFLPSSRSFAFRKVAFESAGGYREDLTFAGEDTALCLEMKHQGRRFVNRLDARVRWYTRPTLKSYLRQHYLYALGDGEAASETSSYLKSLLVIGSVVTLLVAGIMKPLLLLILLAMLTLYYWYLRPKYGWSQRSSGIALCAYLLLLLRQAVKLAGWSRGRISPKRGRISLKGGKR